MHRGAISVFYFLFLSIPVSAAVLLLKDGGSIEGELLNSDDLPRKVYRLKTAGGLEISLDATLVERIQRRERESLIEYNRDAPLTESTLENHLYWAKWCREQQLLDQAKMHWQQVLEFDPDHPDARTVLGYEKRQTGWILTQEKLENRGLVQDRGHWKTPYQIKVENILKNQEQDALYWKNKIRDLCRRLPNAQAEAELLSIRDPGAFVPIRDALLSERNLQHQVTLLRSLVQNSNPHAFQFVVGRTVLPQDEISEELRLVCLEELQKRIDEYPECRRLMIDTYRNCLRRFRKFPEIVHLAAKVLGDIEGYEAVPELIDVLMVMKTEVYQEQEPGYSFGPGKSGISQGARTVKQTSVQQNLAALTALRKLTGVDFGFNQSAWQNWYRQSQRAPSFNLRRN